MEEAVRRYVEAASSGTDAALEAVAPDLADGVTLSSPLGGGAGPDAVFASLRSVQPMLAAATWSDPVVDGDVVTVSATLPPGSVLGTAALTFRFDGNGKIAELVLSAHSRCAASPHRRRSRRRDRRRGQRRARQRHPDHCRVRRS